MNLLTAEQKKTLDQLSQQRDPDVSLGVILNALLSETINPGTPVNAVSASETLTLTGVPIDGETISIGNDTYEFAADVALSVEADNIPIDVNAYSVKATGTLTVDTQPTSGDTMLIGTKTYIFVPDGTANAEGEVSIGADLAEAQANIEAAINGTDGFNNPSAEVTAGEFAANDCIIKALVGGTAGNNIPTTETFTAETNVFVAVKLATGGNCSTANGVIAIVATITASDTEGVSAAAGEGTTVVLTSDLGGIAANEISLATTMVNASFGGTELSGGVDGTIAIGTTLLADDTYLYLCFGGNTITEKNWRRIALGAAY